MLDSVLTKLVYHSLILWIFGLSQLKMVRLWYGTENASEEMSTLKKN